MAINNQITEKKSLVTKNKNKIYQPDEIRSHPFRCISFPTITLTFFIIYWFVITPVIYYCLRVLFYDFMYENYHWYWLVAFIIFIIILVIIVTCWRCKRKQKAPLVGANACGYNIVLQKSKNYYQNSDMSIIDVNKPLKPIEEEKKSLGSLNFEQDQGENSSCLKERDEDIVSRLSGTDSKAKFIEYHQLVTTTPTTASTTLITELLESPGGRRRLTPRQEFFKEFLFDKEHIEQIKPHIVEENEYFIANIPPKSPVLVSEAFIAINDCSVDKSETVREWVVDEEKCTLRPNYSSKEIHDDNVFE